MSFEASQDDYWYFFGGLKLLELRFIPTGERPFLMGVLDFAEKSSLFEPIEPAISQFNGSLGSVQFFR
jgi:hypothetical protein